jgi:hypothetical protein
MRSGIRVLVIFAGLVIAAAPAVAQVTTRVSVSSAGYEANNFQAANVLEVNMSADGRFVVFVSGIGSRFFTIDNSGVSSPTAVRPAPQTSAASDRPDWRGAVLVTRGLDRRTSWLWPDADGVRSIAVDHSSGSRFG